MKIVKYMLVKVFFSLDSSEYRNYKANGSHFMHIQLSVSLKLLQCYLLVSYDSLRFSSYNIKETIEDSLEILLNLLVCKANPEFYGPVMIVLTKKHC